MCIETLEGDNFFWLTLRERIYFLLVGYLYDSIFLFGYSKSYFSYFLGSIYVLFGSDKNYSAVNRILSISLLISGRVDGTEDLCYKYFISSGLLCEFVLLVIVSIYKICY